MQEEQLPSYLRAPFPTLGRQGASVSDHPLASQAAIDTLAAGGNFADASLVQSLVLAVCCPYYTGLGGGGFAIYWKPGWERPKWLDYREFGPAAAHPEVYLPHPAQVSFEGKLAVGVPGAVAGLYQLHQELGQLPWLRLFEPAIELARRGVQVDPNWRRITLMKQQRLRHWPDAARLYLTEQGAPELGERLTFPELAETLRRLSEEGPDYFYRGRLAQQICDCLDHWMGPQDLQDYQPRLREPLLFPWQTGQLYTVSAPSAGGVQLAQILGLVERLGVEPNQRDHLLAEAMRISFSERGGNLGDPDFGSPDSSLGLSQEWFEHWCSRFHPQRRLDLGLPVLRRPGGGTASHAVATSEGVMIITESINHWFGSMLVVPGTGLLLNNIMDDFTTHPQQVDQFGVAPSLLNLPMAGKRPVSSSAPCLFMKSGRPRLLLGSAGGPRITTSVAQLLIHSQMDQMNVAQAMAQPRLHHQWCPDFVEVEPQFPQGRREELSRRGHRCEERACRSHACALECHWEQGLFSAAGDWRSFGGAAAF
jgi:gamma-glutamyltranspeptidase/glutathione hydrolase